MPESNASSDGFERSPLHGEQEDSKPAGEADEPEAEAAAGDGDEAEPAETADAVNAEADAPAGDDPKKEKDEKKLQVGPGPNTGSTAG